MLHTGIAGGTLNYFYFIDNGESGTIYFDVSSVDAVVLMKLLLKLLLIYTLNVFITRLNRFLVWFLLMGKYYMMK